MTTTQDTTSRNNAPALMLRGFNEEVTRLINIIYNQNLQLAANLQRIEARDAQLQPTPVSMRRQRRSRLQRNSEFFDSSGQGLLGSSCMKAKPCKRHTSAKLAFGWSKGFKFCNLPLHKEMENRSSAPSPKNLLQAFENVDIRSRELDLFHDPSQKPIKIPTFYKVVNMVKVPVGLNIIFAKRTSLTARDRVRNTLDAWKQQVRDFSLIDKELTAALRKLKRN